MTLFKKGQHKKERSSFFPKYFKRSKRTFLPSITLFMAFWMGLFKIPSVSFVFPNYVIPLLFFWILYRPDLIPLIFLVVLGVMYDVLSGNVVGQTSFLWILTSVGALFQRRFLVKKPFRMIWGFFSLTFLGYLGLNWIFGALSQRYGSPFFPMMIQFLMTVGAYPFITLFLTQVGKRVSFKTLKETE